MARQKSSPHSPKGRTKSTVHQADLVLASLVKSKREELQMSQTHAASLLGCSNTMLCLYESAKRPIPWVIITRMVAVYHINPAALFTAQASEHTYPEFVEQFQAKSYAFFDMIVQMLAQAREEGAKEALAAHGIS